MKKRILSSLLVGVAALAAMDLTDVAGVPTVASANWNNVSTKGGVSTSLIRDTNGVATTTGATVLWEATNTWA
jgi:hypothetical protein